MSPPRGSRKPGTLLERIRVGEVPREVRQVAEDESVEVERLLGALDKGRVVLPRNLKRAAADDRGGRPARLVGIGAGLRTKVNANLGTSLDYPELGEELEKLRVSVGAGADAIMDLSTGGEITATRRAILNESPVPVGTVPVYQAAMEARDGLGGIVEMTADSIFAVIEEQARDGVDFMTVHSGVTRAALGALREQGRVMDVVSRGGAFLIGWMIHNDRENPLYEHFDRLLDIAAAYDVTLSLGDGMRPGCLADASDRAQFEELLTLGELVRRARAAGVQAMVEGPGHVPLNQIRANVELQKAACRGAPFYVLGPLVTDVAPGYDHITSAIGGAVAGMSGADFLCYVTPREHLGLPTVEDVRIGVIASRIAAHAADVAKGLPGAASWDLEMARARKALDWTRQAELAIDPAAARQGRAERAGEHSQVTCTMCGDVCAMKLVAEALGTMPEEC